MRFLSQGETRCLRENAHTYVQAAATARQERFEHIQRQRELVPEPDSLSPPRTAPNPEPTLTPEPAMDPLYHALHDGSYALPIDGADMDRPAMSDQHWAYVQPWLAYLDKQQMSFCQRCKELWFNIKEVDGICQRCILKDGEQTLHLYSLQNHMDPGDVPSWLPELTAIEQLLIAPIHISMHIAHIKGAQYRYKGHVMTFLRDVPDVVTRLPRLPKHCNTVLIQPHQRLHDPSRGDITQQFRRSFTIRRPVVQVRSTLSQS